MKITYDTEADILAIELRDFDKCSPTGNADLSPDIIALKDDAGELIGLEILDAKKHIDGDPATITFQLLTDDNILPEPEIEEAAAKA
jgi:uncharacterized protein YuzE